MDKDTIQKPACTSLTKLKVFRPLSILAKESPWAGH